MLKIYNTEGQFYIKWYEREFKSDGSATGGLLISAGWRDLKMALKVARSALDKEAAQFEAIQYDYDDNDWDKYATAAREAYMLKHMIRTYDYFTKSVLSGVIDGINRYANPFEVWAEGQVVMPNFYARRARTRDRDEMYGIECPFNMV